VVNSDAALPRDRGLRLLCAAALLVAVAFGSGFNHTAEVLVFWPLLGLACLEFGRRSLLVARRAHLIPAHRRFWRTAAFAGFCWAAGTVTQIPALLRDPLSFDSVFSGPLHAAALGVGVLAIVVSMLTQPLGISSAPERQRFRLDIGTVMVASATVGTYFTEIPGTGAGPTADMLRGAAHLLIGPAAFQVGVFAVVKLHLGGRAPFTRGPAVALAAAAAVTGGTQAIRTELAAADHLSWHYGFTLISMILLIACARMQQLTVRTGPPARGERSPYSVLPYGAIVLTNVLLVGVLATVGLQPRTWIVIVGSVLCTALVIVRQLASFRENVRLLSSLNVALAERGRLAAELRHQAFHDGLTGLANRTRFHEELGRTLEHPTTADTTVAVLLVDLDDFKPVNDQYGHAVGDQLLAEVADRLRACVRNGDVVARLGGDEFAVLCERLPAEAVAPVAERIVAAIECPFTIGELEVRVSASVGLAQARPGTVSLAELMHGADTAMYAAKRDGKGRATVSPAMLVRQGAPTDATDGEPA
jgi:diguanylate cyclase (GGDEF)-like protein